MKFITHLFLAFSLIGLTVLTSSCEESKCGTAICENGGTCDDGLCDCPPGTSGEFCENSLSVQERLDQGEEPLNILNSGVPVESLYGAYYRGGQIFYYDRYNEIPGFQGMVVAEIDATDASSWGCFQYDTDAPNVINTGGDLSGPGFIVSSGLANTRAIINSCPSTPFAALFSSELVNRLSQSWHLPSAGELEAIHDNITSKGLGDFSDGYYWSSTEGTQETAIAVQLKPFLAFSYRDRRDFIPVRLVRIF